MLQIEVPEVSQSEEGQRQKLQIVVQTANRILGQPREQEKWSADLIHQKVRKSLSELFISISLTFHCADV